MIAIRSCAGFDELQACVQLQIETWGIDASEVFPRRAFFLAQKIGGQVIGAFDTEIGRGADALVGYVLSWPGVKSGGGAAQPYLHSHMLAVRAAYRNRGIGAALKLDQRKEALSRGIRRMEWTFDPLEIKNAYLNLHKLGAIAYRYEENFYGVSSSRLQGGLPTDRLVAVWQLDSLRVEAAIEGRPAGVHEVMRRIPIPAAIYEWKASDAAGNARWPCRQKTAARFKRHS